MSARPHVDARIALLLTVPPLMWAGNAVVGRLMVGQVPPLLLNALRWVLAALILLPFGWSLLATPARRRELLERWRPLAMLGLLGVGCYNALQYLALTTSTPLNVTLIAASSPVCMMLIGAVGYGTHPTRRELIGAALSIAGVLLVLVRGDALALTSLRFVPGDLMMLAAVLCWAWYSWMLARPSPLLTGEARPDWDWAAFLLAQTLFGLVWAAAAAGVEAVVAPQPLRWSAGVVLALLYIAVGPAVLAYRCWGLGVQRAGPQIAAFFANLTPLFAALLQTLMLGEAPRAYHALAFALIVGGIIVSSRR